MVECLVLFFNVLWVFDVVLLFGFFGFKVSGVCAVSGLICFLCVYFFRLCVFLNYYVNNVLNDVRFCVLDLVNWSFLLWCS